MASLLRYPSSAYVNECAFETSRSGGAGGQHVNKTESKVTLVFDLRETLLFDGNEKVRISSKMKSHLHDGVIRISSERSRSQIQNKKAAIQLFLELLEKALFVQAKRIPTKVSRSKKEARLKSKKIDSQKKVSRRKPGIE
jgi:ribosome-associated protein